MSSLTVICYEGPGVYHGSLNFNIDTEDHIDSAALLPYPPPSEGDTQEHPLSLSLTEFHFILLYKDRVIGICNLDDKLTYEEIPPSMVRIPTLYSCAFKV